MPGGHKKNVPGTRSTDRIVAPNRKKYEESMDAIMATIKQKNALLKQMQKPHFEQFGESSDVGSELKRVSGKRKSLSAGIESIEQDLKKLAKEVTEKRDQASQLMAGMRYRNEEGFDQAIGKLQGQLDTNEYTPSEEKRLKLEVENLQNSKNSLKEYTRVNTTVEELRDKQSELRKRRDDHYKEEGSLKQQEAGLHDKQTSQRRKQDEARDKFKEEATKRDLLNKEIDALYDQRRELTSEFRRQQEEYLEVTREQRNADQVQRSEETKRKAEERQARHRERTEQKQQRDPYRQEKLLISNLTSYLRRLTLNPVTESHLVGSLEESTGEQEQGLKKWKVTDGSFLKRKSEDGEDQFSVGKRKSKRDKRKSATISTKASKKVNHSATVFDQFHALEMTTPATYADIPVAIGILEQKLVHYNTMSQSEKEPSVVNTSSTSSLTVESDQSMKETEHLEELDKTDSNT